jgi:hypothetical protein
VSAASAAAASKRKGILSLSLSQSLLCFMDMDTGGGREEPKSSLVPVKAQQLVKKSRKRK